MTPTGPRASISKPWIDRRGERGWQRCWVAIAADGNIVGDVELKGSSLTSELHRCELGIGIERPSRGGGLGRRLMETAIEFARGVETLAWVDLRVFAHNAPGRALYRSVGFVEVGTLADRFRIDGQSIGDVMMTLSVG